MNRSLEQCEPGSTEAAAVRQTLHEAAQAYRASWVQLPVTEGFVVFWNGEAIGWTATVADNTFGYLEGCIAVPGEPEAACFVARGGTNMTGATQWEALPR